MQYLIPYLEVFVSVIIFIIGWFVLSVLFRTVVETNKVHIVQRRGRTTSYGVKQPNGNVYFAWPSFLPVIGVNRIILPINNFSVNLDAYDGYDKDRVPFLVHITAFFRIDNPALAAERVAQFSTLEGELKQIVQGAARRVLASHDINEIMIDRSKFGDMFTQEVAGDLINWGIVPVKNMELMDIQDAHGSKVIVNIMAKKASHIEMERRTEVASNRQKAETAEIEA
ncbi:MAG: SPFH domain-containing protein, partial [Myxococcaceae bacterium]